MKQFILALLLAAPMALAAPGGEGNNTGCNGQGNPNSPCDGGNQNANASKSRSNAVSGSESDSESNSNSYSGSISRSGDVHSSNSVQGGRTSSSSEASGGNATGGDASAYGGIGVGGKSEASSTQEATVEVDNSDNSTYSYKDDDAVASAASVFAGYCQTGMSGSVEAGGFSVVNPEAFCNNIRMAAVMQESYTWELQNGTEEQAAIYYERYTDHLDDAHMLLERTNAVATVDSFFGYLVRPLGVIAVLILML